MSVRIAYGEWLVGDRLALHQLTLPGMHQQVYLAMGTWISIGLATARLA